MFHIIGFIFLFIIAIVLIGVLILARILRLLGFGKKRYNKYYNNDMGYSSTRDADAESSDAVTGRVKKKKVFDKNEGEYIDFEDV